MVFDGEVMIGDVCFRGVVDHVLVGVGLRLKAYEGVDAIRNQLLEVVWFIREGERRGTCHEPIGDDPVGVRGFDGVDLGEVQGWRVGATLADDRLQSGDGMGYRVLH